MAATENSIDVSALVRRVEGVGRDTPTPTDHENALHKDAYGPFKPKAAGVTSDQSAPVAPVNPASATSEVGKTTGDKPTDLAKPPAVGTISVLDAQPPGDAKALPGDKAQSIIKNQETSAPQEVAAPTVNTTVSESLGAHTSFTVSDMLYREKYVLGGVKDTVAGIKERTAEAIHDWPLTGFEIVSGIAIGSAMVLASRNPALAGGMKVVNRAMLGIAAADLVSRVAIPSYDALMHPENTEADRKDFGNRIGSAVVDYGMAAVAGGVGSRAFTPVLERTGVGAMLSGYDFLKTPEAELRVFRGSGNALITKNGVRAFRNADMDFSDLDPLASPKGIVGNNDLLRDTFARAEANPNGWRAGKDIAESYGKFATWFETVSGALASELVERSADVGMGLIEHNYLVKTLEHPKESASEGPHPPEHPPVEDEKNP